MKDIMEYFPWGLSVVLTFIAIKSDWIKSQFVKKDRQLEQASTQESIDAAVLNNVEREIGIYRSIVMDLKNEVMETKQFIEEQKQYINRQKRLLERYEKQFGKLENTNSTGNNCEI
tara:strand:- start:7406 stop:7753 length:348 start_codon:yes stop_codon:yes gene_type:complete